MANLLERLLSPLARAESLRTWPPAIVSEHWDVAEDYLRRYTNDRAARLQFAPEFNRTAYGKRIYTPLAIAREVCNFSAEMLFSAEPTITFEDNEDLLERVLDDNGLASALVAMAAKVAAQGRGGLRVFYNSRVNDARTPLIDHVHEHEVIWDEAARFVVGGAVVIERQYTSSAGGLQAEVYRLVEEHVVGGVERRLYRGSSSTLGSPIPLDTIDEFSGLPEIEETNLDAPTLIRWDNVSGGYSDLTGALGVMDRIDADVSYGAEKSEKSRPVSFAPAELFDAAGRIDVSGIVALRQGKLRTLEEDTMKERFGTIQPEFQAEETIAWINFLVDTGVFLSLGYSLASFGRDHGGSADSGKALKLRQARTLLKKAGKDRMASEALRSALAVALAWEDGASAVADYRPEIELGDGLPRDTMEEAQEAGLWETAGAISLEEKVRMRRPDWDEDMVDEEVERIKAGREPGAPGTSVDRVSQLIDGAVNGRGDNGDRTGNRTGNRRGNPRRDLNE